MDMEHICAESSATMWYAPYQTVLAVNSLLSATSLVTIFHFVRSYLLQSPFHPGFRILLLGYFLSAFLHSCLYLAAEVLALSRVIAYQKPCDALLPVVPYMFIHIPLACCLLSGIIVQALLVMERTAATVLVKSYEDTSPRVTLVVYLFLGVVTPVSLIYWAYRGANFDYPVINALAPPKGSEAKVNIIFMSAFSVAFVALAVLRVLAVVNKRQEYALAFSLSSRYQSTENVATTRFITVILAHSLVICLIYTAGTVVLRNFSFGVFSEDIRKLHALKSVFYLHPWFAFSLPVISSWQLSKLRHQRVERTRKMVAVKAKGREGSDAYSHMLHQQWSK